MLLTNIDVIIWKYCLYIGVKLLRYIIVLWYVLVIVLQLLYISLYIPCCCKQS